MCIRTARVVLGYDGRMCICVACIVLTYRSVSKCFSILHKMYPFVVYLNNLLYICCVFNFDCVMNKFWLWVFPILCAVGCAKTTATEQGQVVTDSVAVVEDTVFFPRYVYEICALI